LKRLQDEAYVLRTQPLAEADLIVSLLARDHGRVRGVAKRARSSRRRFGGLLEPLTLVRVEWSEREGRELHRIEALEGLRHHAPMQADPVIQAACAVLTELSDTFAHEGQPEERGFRLLGAVLEALEQGVEPWVVVRYFEYWMLRLHGLFPDLEHCSECGRDLESERLRIGAGGAPLCEGCAASSGAALVLLGRRELGFIDEVRRLPPTGLGSAPRIVRPGGGLERLLRGTLQSFAERSFRTYRHLEEVTRYDGAAGERR